MQFRRLVRLSCVAVVGLLGACSESPVAPADDVLEQTANPARPSALIAAGDGSWHILSETMIGSNFVSEYELGAALLGEEYQGSVFIRVSVPQGTTAGSTSGPCITSTLLKTETRPGWTATVKKAGGCDKPIQVDFTSSTRQRASFKWTYIFGLTKVDHGAVR